LNHARKYPAVTVLVLVSILTSGCASTLPVISASSTAFNLGTMVYQSIENAKILIRTSDGVTKEYLRDIKSIAVFIGQESRVEPCGRIGDVEAVFGDNLAMQLARKGFRIYDADDIKAVDEKPRIRTGYHTEEMLRISTLLGAQAIISGRVVAGKTSSVLGMRKQKTVVHSATLTVTGIDPRQTLMTIDIGYKNGQRPYVAAEGLAIIIQAKLDDPDADIQELLKKEREASPNSLRGIFGRRHHDEESPVSAFDGSHS